MTRQLKAMLVAGVLVMLAATATTTATADPGESPSIGFSLSNGTVWDWHYMGFGVDVSVPFRENRWAYTLGGAYNTGNFKIEDSTPGNSFELKETISGFNIRAGIDRQVSVGPALFYCGSGLFYSTHKFKVEDTGSPDFESEPYNVFGLSNRMGSRIPLSSNPNLELFGQINNTVGFASIDDPSNNQKLTQTDVNNGAEMGLRVNFGATTN